MPWPVPSDLNSHTPCTTSRGDRREDIYHDDAGRQAWTPNSRTTKSVPAPTTPASCSRSSCWPTAKALSPAAPLSQVCTRNVQFIAISGDNQPSDTQITKFVANLGIQIKPLFSQVLMTCDAQGLIGRNMFDIDDVKLPSNASKERSVTHAELRHRADRFDKAADKILALHQTQNKQGATEALESKRQAQPLLTKSSAQAPSMPCSYP